MVEGESCGIIEDDDGGQLAGMMAQVKVHFVQSDILESVSDEWACRHLAVGLDHLLSW